MAASADIDSLMAGDLGHWLQDQGTVRAQAKDTAHWRWTIAACVMLPALALLWFGPDWNTHVKLWATIIPAGAAFAWGQIPIQKAKTVVKHGINAAIAESMGFRYDHNVEPGSEFDYAKAFELVPHFKRVNFEDQWRGQLGGHDFCLYEAHCEVQRGSGKNRRWVTVFRGAIISIAASHRFHGVSLLQRAGKHKRLFGFGGRKDSITLGDVQLGLVDMVHPNFEDAFSVWSTDQVEARALVNPRYIEMLADLENSFDGEDLRALFIDGSLIVALESGNMFESGSIDPSDDAARVEECNTQFATLSGLASLLNEPIGRT